MPTNYALSIAPPSLRLEVHPSGRYLRDALSKEPWLGHGYAGWSAITALTKTEAITFLDAMVVAGVNLILCSLIEKLWTPNPPNNANGDAPFTGTVSGSPDFTTPNTAYWNHVVWFFAAAASRGIRIFANGCYFGFIGASPDEGFGAVAMPANGTTRLTTYGAFLGTTFASVPNLAWVWYGDALPDATGRSLVKAVYDGVKSTDAAGRLHGSHFARGSLSTDDTTIAVDFNFAYSAGGSTSPRVHKKVLDGYAVSGPKPVGLGEDEYVNRASGAVTAQQQRQQAWDNWLSGGCFKIFGDEWTWSFDIPNPSNQAPVQHWYNHLADTPVSHFGFVRKFLVERQWWKALDRTLVGSLITSGGGTVDTDGYKPRFIAFDGSFAAVDCVDGSAVTIALSLMRGATRARWYDPTTGTYSADISGSPFAASGTHAFTPPGNNSAGGTDLVLALDA